VLLTTTLSYPPESQPGVLLVEQSGNATTAAYEPLIEARSRITVSASPAGAMSLHVKMANGFRIGARLRINPGGATEEDNVLLRSPFALKTPLRHMHGLGEAVLQLADSDTQPQSRPPPMPPQRETQPAPPPEPQPVPLFDGFFTQIYSRSTRYVYGHWGWEAAVAFMLVLLGALCMGAYVVQIFFEYSLCCLGRGKALCCLDRRPRPRQPPAEPLEGVKWPPRDPVDAFEAFRQGDVVLDYPSRDSV